MFSNQAQFDGQSLEVLSRPFVRDYAYLQVRTILNEQHLVFIEFFVKHEG